MKAAVLYDMAGRLKLDKLITRTCPLEGINDAFEAMKAGEVARSLISLQDATGRRGDAPSGTQGLAIG